MLLAVEVRADVGHRDRSRPVAGQPWTGALRAWSRGRLIQPGDGERHEVLAERAVHPDRAVAAVGKVIVLDPDPDLIVVGARDGPRDGRAVLVDGAHAAFGRIPLATLEEALAGEGEHAIAIEQACELAHHGLTWRRRPRQDCIASTLRRPVAPRCARNVMFAAPDPSPDGAAAGPRRGNREASDPRRRRGPSDGRTGPGSCPSPSERRHRRSLWRGRRTYGSGRRRRCDRGAATGAPRAPRRGRRGSQPVRAICVSFSPRGSRSAPRRSCRRGGMCAGRYGARCRQRTSRGTDPEGSPGAGRHRATGRRRP